MALILAASGLSCFVTICLIKWGFSPWWVFTPYSILLWPLLKRARTQLAGLRLKTKWTLFLVQTEKIRALKKKIDILENEKASLNQELNGLQKLWMMSISVPPPRINGVKAPRLKQEQPITHPLFSERFFDLYEPEATQSHSMTDANAL